MSNMINLETFAGGELARKINVELTKVLNNIYNPNTEATKARKITATITLKPGENRTTAAIKVQVSSTLQPTAPAETNIVIDMDYRTGKAIATEVGSEMAGQIRMGENNGTYESRPHKKQEGIINLETVKENKG